jgi:hypothetical protein
MMSEIDDGEQILGTLIAEAEDVGFLSEGEARALNEDLQDVVSRLHEAYERGADSDSKGR